MQRPYGVGGVNLVMALALVGCTTTTAIRPSELTRLDGYDRLTSPATRELETPVGAKVPFDHNSDLRLELPGGSEQGHFAVIRAREGLFEGRTTGGREIRVPLDKVIGAQVKQPNVPGTVAILLGGMAVLAGLAFFFSATTNQGVPGRPLRIERKIVVAPPSHSEGWGAKIGAPDLSNLSPAARAALAAMWTQIACGEHASVPSFARLSLTLVALGAPARLVEGAHRAALDEIAHARLAFALAAAYSGARVAPGRLAELHGATAVSAQGPADLAVECLLDGCLNETVSAEVAREAWARAVDPVVRATLAVIGSDEEAHAELSWDVLAWCCRLEGAELQDRLRRLVRTAPSIVGPGVPAEVEPEVAKHGWLDQLAWRRVSELTRARTAARLEEFFRSDPEAGLAHALPS